jgi:phosphate transport system permease protein
VNEYTLLILLLLISTLWFYFGNKTALSLKNKQLKLNSLPHYYGIYVALCSFIPALFSYLLILVFDGILFSNLIMEFVPKEILNSPDFNKIIVLAQIDNAVRGIYFGEQPDWVTIASNQMIEWNNQSLILNFFCSISLALGIGYLGFKNIHQEFRSRNSVEKIIISLLGLSSIIAILTTIGIVFSVIFESLRFFAIIPASEFLFGLTWNPQFEGAERAGSGQEGLASYGSVPLFVGTFLISLIALCVSVPIGLFSAVYLSEYANQKERSIFKPLLEILAGIPTVVYGFFAALTVAPLMRNGGSLIGLDVASESALAAGFVMGIMIIPFISSLSDDVINAVPQSLRDAGYGLGSTKNEVITNVIIPAALPGIIASIILAVSRAIGETMIVVMAAGLAANLSFNPLDAVTTVTAQIVTILVGDQEFESAKTLSAFALALTLIVITLILNFYALHVVKKYREQYE